VEEEITMRLTILSWRALFVLAAIGIATLGARSDATSLRDITMQGIYGAGCYNIELLDGCWFPENCDPAGPFWLKTWDYGHERDIDNAAFGKEFINSTSDRTECLTYIYDEFPCASPVDSRIVRDSDYYLYGDDCEQ